MKKKNVVEYFHYTIYIFMPVLVWIAKKVIWLAYYLLVYVYYAKRNTYN